MGLFSFIGKIFSPVTKIVSKIFGGGDKSPAAQVSSAVGNTANILTGAQTIKDIVSPAKVPGVPSPAPVS